MDNWAFIVLMIVIVAASVAVRVLLDRRRTEAVKATANDLNFQYMEASRSAVSPQVWDFSLFSRGRSRRLKNVIQGHREGAKIAVGDYYYTSGSGKNRTTYHQTVAIVESDALHLPSFMVGPENMFHKIGGLFGYHDIDFDTHPEFSRRYLLRGSDEDAIRRLFDSGVLMFYQNQSGVSTEGMGSVFIYYRDRRGVAPKHWQGLVNEAVEAHRHLATNRY